MRQVTVIGFSVLGLIVAACSGSNDPVPSEPPTPSAMQVMSEVALEGFLFENAARYSMAIVKAVECAGPLLSQGRTGCSVESANGSEHLTVALEAPGPAPRNDLLLRFDDREAVVIVPLALASDPASPMPTP